MAISIVYLLNIAFLVFAASKVTAQIAPSPDTDYSCSADTPASCDTYVTYRARPPYMDLGSISDVMGVSRLSIVKASGVASEGARLFPDQILLVPIKCFCNGSRYFSNVTYQIKKGDNLYTVSTGAFENLTDYHLVEDLNPMLNINNLTIGLEVIFPLVCKCVDHLVSDKGIRYLVTYVWQPFDDASSVSHMFGASATEVVRENNNRNFTAAICLPVLIPVKFPMILQPPPPSKSSRHKWIILVAGLSFAGSLTIVLSLSMMAYVKKRAFLRQSSCPEASDLIQTKKGSIIDETFEPKAISQDKLLPGVSGYLGKPIVYDLNVIMEATMNLSERFRIGKSVYRAIIKDQAVAVKKTNDAAEELRILQKVNHANLVKLMGVSSDKEKNFYLVYEYVENGSLDKWLFTKPSSSTSAAATLTWNQRLQIALDVANALQYLHEHTQPSIAHGDIRASNILLDSRFRAKIANFSTAKHAASELAVKSDVFAFGVVLLELLSGKKGMQDGGEVLEDEEKRGERLRRWMDPGIMKGFYSIDDALSLAALAKACTSDKASERPRMTDIVFNLSFLTQSTFGMFQSCFTSGDAEEPVQILSPVTAR
ncbi:PREDICTED: serine/threonine receptor-like kinase NFP [Ipomoea nil]|uniref:serine/threonine receptor-like kinase NFP n=1 Tax=Ipomoea nil TaxID=35883 RepID=UPI000900DAA0|nr:PREDICTED: serine/threonine receptor-like kinase NFP [Ipomoea nil]XP_019195090.1 PREDICTED: serine/threonine receptor-like kinase NFP [Ipomoea nil]